MKSASPFFPDFPKTSAYDLTLFIMPSPGINWATPGSLTRTTLRNKLLKMPRGIGHVCIMLRGPDREELTGMTQKESNEGRPEVLRKGYGLGILLHNFVGELERAEELVPEINRRSKKGNLTYARFDLSEAAGKRLFQYLDEYRARGGDQWYGMRNRPRHLEGGGCGPFAGSCVEIAGLMTKEIETAWTREIRIPLDYLGGPITGKFVSPFKLMLAREWAKETDAHEKGLFWDPDLMNEWTLRQTQSVQWRNARGAVLDFRDHTPVPEPIFFV
jgi:hypothetical protein